MRKVHATLEGRAGGGGVVGKLRYLLQKKFFQCHLINEFPNLPTKSGALVAPNLNPTMQRIHLSNYNVVTMIYSHRNVVEVF